MKLKEPLLLLVTAIIVFTFCSFLICVAAHAYTKEQNNGIDKGINMKGVKQATKLIKNSDGSIELQ